MFYFIKYKADITNETRFSRNTSQHKFNLISLNNLIIIVSKQ